MSLCGVATPRLRAQGFLLLQEAAYATINGSVEDGSGRPVSAALVTLQARGSTEESTTTNAQGAFTFQSLRPGRYELSAERSDLRSAAMRVELKAAKPFTVHILLRPVTGNSAGHGSQSGEASLEFSDKPTFSVAGVTDWTAAGGHGSDVTLRTSEDLTRDTVALRAHGRGSGELFPEDRIGVQQEENRLRAAATASPQSYEANRSLGEFYLHEARYRDAIVPLQAASELDGDKAGDEFNLALVYQGLRDYSQARQHAMRALARQDRADFHRVAGELDEALDDPLTALREEELATRMAPTEQNYFVWGSELLRHRAISQAAEVFARGAKAHPASARMKSGWGAALFAGARYDDAAQRLCEASDLDRADSETYLFIGRIALAAPSPLKCVGEKLARFLGDQPNSADANYFQAMYLLKQRDNSNVPPAVLLLRKTIALESTYVDAYLQLGILAFQDHRYTDAIELYRKAADADPQQADVHYRLGLAYDRAGQREEAQRQFQIHNELAKAQAEKVEQERRRIKQFVIVSERQQHQE